MIVERSLHPQFVSNTYLVADRDGGTAFFVDAGGPLEPLIEAAERHNVTPTHVLLTHHHYDHVCETDTLTTRWPDIEVLIDPQERELVANATGTMTGGQDLRIGDLTVRPLATPGHTAGMLALLVFEGDNPAGPGGDGSQTEVFTGDTLFKGSVGGVHAPGHTTYADLRDSVMDTLMKLPPNTTIRPGHTDPSTVAHEWETNGFIRLWRGLDAEQSEPCTVFDRPATLVLWGDDYDGGHKAWIRWADGADDIVAGSQVVRGAGAAPA